MVFGLYITEAYIFTKLNLSIVQKTKTVFMQCVKIFVSASADFKLQFESPVHTYINTLNCENVVYVTCRLVRRKARFIFIAYGVYATQILN